MRSHIFPDVGFCFGSVFMLIVENLLALVVEKRWVFVSKIVRIGLWKVYVFRIYGSEMLGVSNFPISNTSFSFTISKENYQTPAAKLGFDKQAYKSRK